ncbi:MAG: DUF418 domain-containing protein [Pseudomonadota bacterium]
MQKITGVQQGSTTGRIDELDVLRGFALLGVFIVHFVGSAYFELPLAEETADRWFDEWPHFTALFVSDLFFQNKANTLFATLFGMGFWVMLTRLAERGANATTIYVRRLLALFVLGVLNVIFIFPGDVLHEYALIGLVLLLLRHWPLRAQLIVGLCLAFFGGPLVEHLFVAIDWSDDWFDKLQEAAFKDGGYGNWVATMSVAHFQRNFLMGGLLGWGLYILGRFLLGTWLMRVNWVEWLRGRRVWLLRAAVSLSALGLTAELVSLLIFYEIMPGPAWLDVTLHTLGAPILAAAYALLLVYWVQSSNTRGMVMWLAPVGKVALTAYVLHGLVFTLCYMPFGLDLLGRAGPAIGLLMAVGLYVLLTILASLWLVRFRYGPLEFFWRWATYGARPEFRRHNREPA